MDRKVEVIVSDIGNVSVKFINGHVSKRELIRLIKAIKFEHRFSIREYRKNLIEEKKKSNSLKEIKDDDAGRNQSIGKSEDSSSSEGEGGTNIVPATTADRRIEEVSGVNKK